MTRWQTRLLVISNVVIGGWCALYYFEASTDSHGFYPNHTTRFICRALSIAGITLLVTSIPALRRWRLLFGSTIIILLVAVIAVGNLLVVLQAIEWLWLDGDRLNEATFQGIGWLIWLGLNMVVAFRPPSESAPVS